jgi:hypothetical protein
MPLRSLIKASPETLSDFVLAAQDRYDEAETLLLHEQFDGAVYLLGYGTEMWLKISCLRLQRLGPSGNVKAGLAPLKTKMMQIAPGVVFTDNHNLAYFAQAVIELRRNRNRPLPPTSVRELQSRVIHGLYGEWIVDMRYRRSALTANDAWFALVNTWWVKENWTKF